MLIVEEKVKNNHYAKRYESFIKSRIELNKTRNLTDVYTEKHHIIPRSLGGSNRKYNIVVLTYREHFIAHIMLYYIYDCWQMANAIIRMSDNKKHKNSRIYEVHRRNAKLTFGIHQKKNSTKGKKVHTEEFKNKMSKLMSGEGNTFYGKRHTQETLDKIQQKRKITMSTDAAKDKHSKNIKKGLSDPDIRKKMSDAKSGKFSCINKQGDIKFIDRDIFENQSGDKEDWEWVTISSYEGKRRKGEEQFECPYCGKLSYKMIHLRYHGVKCKKAK